MLIANTPIKNRHFSASDEAKEILKAVLISFINPISYVISFMISSAVATMMVKYSGKLLLDFFLTNIFRIVLYLCIIF